MANSLIFHNVFAISQALQQLVVEGYAIESEAIAALSLYGTQQVNRFGIYNLNRKRHPPTLDYQAPIASATLFSTQTVSRTLKVLPGKCFSPSGPFWSEFCSWLYSVFP